MCCPQKIYLDILKTTNFKILEFALSVLRIPLNIPVYQFSKVKRNNYNIALNFPGLIFYHYSKYIFKSNTFWRLFLAIQILKIAGLSMNHFTIQMFKTNPDFVAKLRSYTTTSLLCLRNRYMYKHRTTRIVCLFKILSLVVHKKIAPQ